MGILQEIEIWSYYQMVCAQVKICPGKCDVQILKDFKMQTDLPNPGYHKTRPCDSLYKRKEKIKKINKWEPVE